ncbi:hypothetical protein SAPIO_CDS2402 [Scedosporium apiospermum]|uniref:Uncharacterized protein n=1 Tax=Pseudallescheria apiosperma TaxID=563466 RepID=A0A084GCE8_PSEDA|nr:uncharacterized protein SAPIO_CDS2402 [Scedosporium apiospermum]KEZ45010.1 hypothetical protein SAPIO_CDS2402 [Scedosporium apiospermum]
MTLFSALFLLTLSTSSVIAHIVPLGSISIAPRDHQPDSETIAAWETTGSRFSYFDHSDPQRCVRPCVKYCKDVEHKGGPKLDDVLCAVFLSAFDTNIQTGLLLVPGGIEEEIASNGVRLAVQGAKTFTENGGDAANFFGGWVGPACHMPNWNSDVLSMIFGVLNNAPDSTGTSIGCVQKNKAACRKPDRKPDPPPKSKGPDDKPKTEDPPSPTSKPSEPDKTSKVATSTSKSTTKNACAAKSTSKPNHGTKRTDDSGILDLLRAPTGRAAELITQFRNSARKPSGQTSKRNLEHDNLKPRTGPPAGYMEVVPSSMNFTQDGRPNVWSRDYGTCPEVVLVGKPKSSNHYKGNLLHMSLGESGEGFFKVRQAFNGLIDAVTLDGMTDMRGWL